MKNLKKLRTENSISQKQLSDILGIARSTVAMWETGASAPDNQTLKKLSDYFECSADYLLDRTDIKNSNTDIFSYENIRSISVKKLPLLGKIACGEPIFANEERESYVECGDGIQADFCLVAKGDSMINARIYDGDIVFVRRQDMVENGEIAVVIIEDEATLKRVSYFPEKNMLILKPENPAYKDFVYVGEELNHIRILGKAVAFQGDIV